MRRAKIEKRFGCKVFSSGNMSLCLWPNNHFKVISIAYYDLLSSATANLHWFLVAFPKIEVVASFLWHDHWRCGRLQMLPLLLDFSVLLHSVCEWLTLGAGLRHSD